METQDPFQEFGGNSINSDPFAEFGGKTVNNNNFAEFGGQLINKDPFVEFDGQQHGPPVTKVPAKQFLANYMSSPIYKQRLYNSGVSEQPDVNNVLNAHISQVNGAGSVAYNKEQWPDMNSQKAGFPIKNGVSNINIDRKDVANVDKIYGVKNTPENTLSHELSHVSRVLSPQEESLIGSLNRKSGESDVWKSFLKSGANGSFSDYLNNNYDRTHDARPAEIKADLDALRYSMFKKGIYDTSKREMTIDDYKKAVQDSDIKKSLEFKRLSERFKPDDLILLNNSIAANKNNSNTNQYT